VIGAMREHPEGGEARVVCEVVEEEPASSSVMRTRVGGRRIVDTLQGDKLSRIY
jgi:hydrogenase expression/formation protein HypE